MQGTQYATKRSILCRGAFCGPTMLYTISSILLIGDGAAQLRKKPEIAQTVRIIRPARDYIHVSHPNVSTADVILHKYLLGT